MDPDENTETAPCKKCNSMITTEADRCPECGHEPGPGAIGVLFMGAFVIVGLLFGLFAMVSFIGAFIGAGVVGSLLLSAVTGVIAVLCFAPVYYGIKNISRGPTEL